MSAEQDAAAYVYENVTLPTQRGWLAAFASWGTSERDATAYVYEYTTT